MALFIELYCGGGNMSSAFKNSGFDILSVDIRKRIGTCEPVLQKDILKIKPGELTRLCKKYAAQDIILWASPPCPVFSHAAGNRYFENGKLRPELAKKSTKHIKKVMRIIDELQPLFWFIENPRGHLRYCKFFVDWIVKRQAMIKELTYSSYGLEFPKPTNLFTNALNYTPRPLTEWGKGAKYPGQMNNLTTCQRQQIPPALCEEICNWSLKIMKATFEHPTPGALLTPVVALH